MKPEGRTAGSLFHDIQYRQKQEAPTCPREWDQEQCEYRRSTRWLPETFLQL